MKFNPTIEAKIAQFERDVAARPVRPVARETLVKRLRIAEAKVREARIIRNSEFRDYARGPR